MAVSNPVNEYYAMPEVEGPASSNGDGYWLPVAIESLGHYQVSILGEIRTGAGKLLSPYLNGKQLYVGLKAQGDGAARTLRVDRIVLATFTRASYKGEVPRHLDRNTLNCAASNLEWADEADPEEGPMGAAPVSQTKARVTKAIQTNRESAVTQGRWGGTQKDRQRIRDWANANGYEQSNLGQLKTEVVNAYYEANPDEERLDGVTNWPKTKTRKKSRKRRTVASAKINPDKLVMSRTYRLGGITVEVTDDITEISIPHMPKIKLDREQLRALARITAQVEEMNHVMGR